MPPYHRFEDVPIWRLAADLYDRIDDFNAQAPSRLQPAFRAELDRAALAVSNRIAEGYERGSHGDLLAALRLARCSAAEVRSMLIVATCRPYLADRKVQLSDLMNLVESCCRQLHSLSESLQRSRRTPPGLAAPDGRVVMQRRRGKKVAPVPAAGPV